MTKLALTIGGLSGGSVPIQNPAGFNSNFTSVNSVVSAVFSLGIYVGFVLAMSWLAWGVFQYITAGGNKEGLARARARITWAIIGLVVILLAWSISRVTGEIFQINNNANIPNITSPG